MHRLFDDLRAALANEFTRVGLLGPVGIDAFVFRDADGAPRLKPVVEINPRYTMGRLTLELMRHVAPGSGGRFWIANRASLRAANVATFADLAAPLTARDPIVREGSPIAKIATGTVLLGDPATARTCLPVFEVRRTSGAATRQ
jgi:hypothetical protein